MVVLPVNTYVAVGCVRYPVLESVPLNPQISPKPIREQVLLAATHK